MAVTDQKRSATESPVRVRKLPQLVVILVVSSCCLALCMSYIYGKQMIFYDTPPYLSVSENISKETSLTEVTKVPAQKTSPRPHQRDGPQLLVDHIKVKSVSSSFSSPFIYSKGGASSRDVNLKGKYPGTSPKTKTKTIAVVMQCANSTSDFISSHNYLRNCASKTCRMTSDLEKADIVVVFMWRMGTDACVPKFRRPSGQKWVMWTNEAASRKNDFSMLDLPSLIGQFNWTMTYRLDSDIVQLYGNLEKQKLQRKNYVDIYTGKKVIAAWFVSHCKTSSLRRFYVKRMQNIIDVHIFGLCGTYNCSSGHNYRRSDKTVCFPMLSRSYFFYLAFENSLCKDYVTEKFFKIFQNVDLIPVVRGGADYKRFFPPGTFIDASDFASPEDLAKFLLNLSKDRKRYIDMLKEKSRYTYRSPQNAFCELCDKLQRDDSEKWYPDLRRWFVQGQCHEPTDL